MKRIIRKLTFLLLTAALVSIPLVSCEKEADRPASPQPEEETELAAPPAEEIAESEETAAAENPWTEPKHPLRFDENGEFRILVFSDIHGPGAKISTLAKTNIALLVEREEPDLVLLDGDNTWGLKDENTLKSCVGDIVEAFEERHIPWAHVYGNHDAESNNVKKETQQKIYESFAYCVSEAGDPSLPGVGNYVLPVYASDGSRVLFNVWMLDSGQYITSAERAALAPVASIFPGYTGAEYDFIRPAQIEWYREKSRAMEEYNGGKVPGLMAFHIPLQESYAAWVNREALEHTGEKREAVCSSAINSGMYSALFERGDIKAVVNGHDHVNDYMVNYGGIKLCYCSTVSETGYCNMDMLGARVFVIREDDPADVRTYMSYVDESRMEDPDEFLDAEPLPGGVVLDFEAYDPEIEKCGWDNNYNDGAHVSQITVGLEDGRGVNGSRALAVGRLNFGDSTESNNAEVKIPIETPGTLGELAYLRVWMDLTGVKKPIDFRKACFGLIVNDMELMPYRTDELDSPSPFWVLPEGETAWKRMSHGSDGCFGAQQDSSVKGFKGWLAFPVENMLKRSTLDPLTESSCVTGVYFYYCFSSREMAGESAYLDEIALVKDYKVFD
ncbi:MAG: metallophosphoesterase family protein [Clostridiales bacterium]|nr:metallophosphoesterase family protein [Clostridiales bacterium]